MCTGDRSSSQSLTCDFELISSAPVENAQCITCGLVEEVTWFGQATNDVKVAGPNGGLVKTRVQSNHVQQEKIKLIVFFKIRLSRLKNY